MEHLSAQSATMQWIILVSSFLVDSECVMKITNEASQEDIQLDEEGQTSTRCPSCRCRVDRKNTIDYLTFKRVHQPNSGNILDSSEDEDNFITDDEEVDSNSDST